MKRNLQEGKILEEVRNKKENIRRMMLTLENKYMLELSSIISEYNLNMLSRKCNFLAV